MTAFKTADSSKSSLAVWIPIVVGAIVAISGGIAWLYAHHEQYQSNVVAEERENQKLWCQLKVIQTKLDETRDMSRDLQANYLVKPWGILESYVSKARKTGETKQALMREKIDSLVKANDEIISRIRLYLPNAMFGEFGKQAQAYIYHAVNYSDRWRAVPRVIQSSEQLPFAVPFPEQFPTAVNEELKRRDALSKANHSALKLWVGQEDSFPVRNCSSS
ncbi:hypothetical protein B0G80_2037 [Paraburkholderia sp. BL6669N2]|uniref:hypothetical protein n=1 Tax=Paraburkholderia sp. BL6669N2 TaxID=1938807 RepID=UPI000E235D18|nr:hypothetical protein [Paraburkholderia sp. BL6669N2]REG59302.1 hypothetical protein B0G80_2037 [Paraburkholderia sp. BL6669N2]